MESAHDKLFKAGAHDAIAFGRKYGLTSPIPEDLNNYMDVRNFNTMDFFSILIFFSLGSILRCH